MSLIDNFKEHANNAKNHASEKMDIAKQRADGESDKASADNAFDKLKGEVKIKDSQARDKMS